MLGSCRTFKGMKRRCVNLSYGVFKLWSWDNTTAFLAISQHGSKHYSSVVYIHCFICVPSHVHMYGFRFAPVLYGIHCDLYSDPKDSVEIPQPLANQLHASHIYGLAVNHFFPDIGAQLPTVISKFIIFLKNKDMVHLKVSDILELVKFDSLCF